VFAVGNTRFSTVSTGIASAVQDAPTVGVKVYVREGEPLALALRRFQKLVKMARVRTSRGPLYWMRGLTRDYYRKPSVLKRIKRLRKRIWAQRLAKKY